MKIKVTEEHIKKGRQHSECACPVALAMREKFPNCEVWGNGKFYIEGKTFEEPEIVQEFIERFDSDDGVVPFEFEVEIADGERTFTESQLRELLKEIEALQKHSPFPTAETFVFTSEVTRLFSKLLEGK